jgi:hypothetical protein
MTKTKITAYQVIDNPPPIFPAEPTREWMNQTSNKFAYRCLPLVIGNTYGWEIKSNSEFIAKYDGGRGVDAIQILKIAGTNFPQSHFGDGILTWSVGYLFKTEYPYGLYITGGSNVEVSNPIPLTGIVETYWLPFTFTMNWRFTQKGLFHMKPGDTICQIFPVDMAIFDNISTELVHINNNSELINDYREWSRSRTEFNNNPNRLPKEWQKNYFRGTFPHKEGKEVNHKTNLNVPEFKTNND